MPYTRRQVIVAGLPLLVGGCLGRSAGGTTTGTISMAPQANFALERDGSTVIIEHRGGDTLDADTLEVRIGGTPTRAQWADEYGEIRAGDTLRVDASGAADGATLRIVWTPEDGGESTVIAEFSLA